jgi:hypothetical protein
MACQRRPSSTRTSTRTSRTSQGLRTRRCRCGAEVEADIEAQRLAVQTRLRAYFTKGRPRVVFTDNLHTMLSIKRGQGVWTLRMHQMFATAPPAVLRAVAQYAQTQDRQAAGLLRRYIDHNDHQIRPQMEPRAQVIDVQGAHHNLQTIFDDLNARYFGGRSRRASPGDRARGDARGASRSSSAATRWRTS